MKTLNMSTNHVSTVAKLRMFQSAQTVKIFVPIVAMKLGFKLTLGA